MRAPRAHPRGQARGQDGARTQERDGAASAEASGHGDSQASQAEGRPEERTPDEEGAGAASAGRERRSGGGDERNRQNSADGGDRDGDGSEDEPENNAFVAGSPARRAGFGGVEAVGQELAVSDGDENRGEEQDGSGPRDVRGRDGHDGSGQEGTDGEGQGLEPGCQEVPGGESRRQDDAGGPLAGDSGDRREVAHECDQRDRPEEGTDVESGRHARVSEAEAGSDDDAEDCAGKGAVGDGFGEEDALVQVCERADESTEGSDQGDVQGGDEQEAEDHEASPAISSCDAHVSRTVSRSRPALSPVSRAVSRAELRSGPATAPVSCTVSRAVRVP